MSVAEEEIRRAFLEGVLRVKSVDRSGQVCWLRVGDVHKSKNREEMVEVATSQGVLRVTARHPVYVTPTLTVDAQDVDGLVWSETGEVEAWVRPGPFEEDVFDLTVEDPSCFLAAKSGVLVHNSPDRNYKFRPPEQEGQIGQYNRVFGYIWEDYELVAYLQMSLDWFMSMPPQTVNIQSLDQLCAQMPAWRSWILWGAAVYALFALSINWVHDEFSIDGQSKVRLHFSDGRSVEVSLQDLFQALKEG